MGGWKEDGSVEARVGVEPTCLPLSPPVAGMSGRVVFAVSIPADDGGDGSPWLPLIGDDEGWKHGGNGGDGDALGVTLLGLVSGIHVGRL